MLSRHVRHLLTLVCAFGLMAQPAPAASAARPLDLHDLRGMVGISDVRMSPDGSRVAFVRSIGDYKNDRWNKTLMLVPFAGGTPVPVPGLPRKFSASKWTPGGDAISYLAPDRKKIDQLFVISPGRGAALQITHAASDVEQYAYSPDGSRVAYVAADKSSDALWEVHDDGYLSEDGPTPSHIWLLPSGGGSARQLTHGPSSVLEAAPPFVGAPTDPSWSADGKTIAFTMQSDADDSDSDRTMIASVNADSGAVSRLTGRRQYEYEPAYAAAGSDLAFLYPRGPGPISALNVHVWSNGMDRNVTASFDRDVSAQAWLPDNGLLMLASDGPRSTLYVQSAGSAARPIDLGGLNASEFSAAKNGAIAVIASAADKPEELYALDSPTAKPRQLTHVNAAFASFAYGRSVELTWTAPDGERSDGVLTYPVNYAAGKKYPLVLRIHGGPEAASTLGFSTLRQLFAGRGAFVLEPNYRGSDNLGTAHEHAIYRDPGTGPGNDVIAAVRKLERLGLVDPRKEAVTGHSYGGYMTTWLIGHRHSWRCAVVGDGMVDWVDEYNLSAAGNLAWTRDSLGGSPSDPSSAALYRAGSPITYASGIVTPTRIISGTADQTVPAAESYALYHILHDRGVPVSFIAIPGAHHFPSDPVHIEGYNRVTLEWVARYL